MATQQSDVEIESRDQENHQDSRASAERISLLRGTERHSQRHHVNIHCNCCRWWCLNSKAAILTLVWNVSIVMGLSIYFDPGLYITFGYLFLNNSSYSILIESTIVVYIISAITFLLYPLAGCLADVRWGRYTTIRNSLCFIFWSSIILAVLLSTYGGVGVLVVISFSDSTILVPSLLTLSGVIGVPLCCGVLLIICSYVAFNANVIQFGTDQLHDAPTEDSVLFIHWYVWTTHLGTFLMNTNISLSAYLLFTPSGLRDLINIILFITFLFGLGALMICCLGVTLCIHQYKRHWFMTDSGSRNPYKLVYKVLKFAKNHTNPIRRSAFTYCEDELPSRLDLGKEKYGGPFTTEQIENVKVFLGILCILLSLGPIMMVDNTAKGTLTKFADHMDHGSFVHPVSTLIYTGSLTKLLVVIFIPVYLCLLRPFVRKYIPGMLKRIGLGMIFILLSTLCTLSFDTYGHARNLNMTTCFLSDDSLTSAPLNINSNLLIIQSSLNAIGYMLFYIAVYEFICAQSPHSMKGLVIGTFFAIKGVFQLLGVVIILLPFNRHWKFTVNFPSCGFVYYLINAIIALIGIVAYTCVARQYQYRQRDEPDNIYRYAEEYYANAQDGSDYEYDNDYDNLNVETMT